MPTLLNPYLSFRGKAREAMEFYKSVFGGELNVMTFGQGNMAQDPSETNQIMHAMLRAQNGMVLMGSDTPARMEYKPGNTMTVSLSGEDEAELRGYWNKLAEGGHVSFPLAKAQWGDTFGMPTDRYGTPWMVNIAGQRQ
jgi:PhnB protein